MEMTSTIPIVLFAYARPELLRKTLDCLRENHVPLLYAFSDGPRTPDLNDSVTQVRNILRSIDWCEVVLREQKTNLGLGVSIRTGVSEVLSKHEMAIIFEDDLICVPGTYEYLCAALRQYKHDPRVMSVTGWTHPKITPEDVYDQPYFDGRAECLAWGTWARAWNGMKEDAMTLMRQCEANGIDVYRYAADLVEMAKTELRRNIWAVRFLYWHILNHGLCLRPPHSMVEHLGFGTGTNCTAEELPWFVNPPLRSCPPIPTTWPEPVENTRCWTLHQAMCGGGRPPPRAIRSRVMSRLQRYARRLASAGREGSRLIPRILHGTIPPVLWNVMRRLREWSQTASHSAHGWSGNYATWDEAAADTTGYETGEILRKALDAERKVRRGEAAFERDTVTFEKENHSWPTLSALLYCAAASEGRLRVVDFGGALGSTWSQYRHLWLGLRDVHWAIVELPAYVEAGMRHLSEPKLSFHTSIEDAQRESKATIFFSSSAIQYLPEPYRFLKEISMRGFDFLFLDRISLTLNDQDRITVQRVNPEIYTASYPCWFLSETRLREAIGSNYRLTVSFAALDKANVPSVFRGYLFERKGRREKSQ